MDEFEKMYKHANSMGARNVQQNQKVIVGLIPSTASAYQTP
jgi:hypothetical protein